MGRACLPFDWRSVPPQRGERLFLDAGHDMHKGIDYFRDVVLNRCAQHQRDFVGRQLVIGRQPLREIRRRLLQSLRQRIPVERAFLLR